MELSTEQIKNHEEFVDLIHSNLKSMIKSNSELYFVNDILTKIFVTYCSFNNFPKYVQFIHSFYSDLSVRPCIKIFDKTIALAVPFGYKIIHDTEYDIEEDFFQLSTIYPYSKNFYIQVQEIRNRIIELGCPL